ncbi:hydroxylase [Paraflavitalea soli]|uniref:Hydroxylase n=1 Tax=Paraflavitalea soli TaxID=2315862 RepID=A0A3B7MKP5_9BACT|nr:cupin-like domain-containing protein [Paraflavitalea soli]AXY73680.1 hydroxylase [Paraflavitalea soli]
MKINRVRNITPAEFLHNHLIANQPVIIEDGMADWQTDKFQPQYLDKAFGDQEVQIYNDLFDLQTIDSLHNYLSENFNRPAVTSAAPSYVRWYTKLRNVDFYWADKVFEALSGYWTHPYFLSDTDTIIPYTQVGTKAAINNTRYPYKGLFISGKGARTRLHKDPFGSNALLCQFYGQKKIILYAPDQEPFLMNEEAFVDIVNPDRHQFPDFDKAIPSYEEVLSPGEIVLFPGGWFHDVTCITDSISITWNFVPIQEVNKLASFIRQHPHDSQLDIVRFFLSAALPIDASAEEIVHFLSAQHESSKAITL